MVYFVLVNLMGIDALDSLLTLESEPAMTLRLEPTPPTTPRGSNNNKNDRKKPKERKVKTPDSHKTNKSADSNIFDMMGLQTVDDLLLGDLDEVESRDYSEISEVSEDVTASETDIQTEIGDIGVARNNKQPLRYDA